jgi:hypothetical protein
MAADDGDDEGELELLQATASTVSGISAAAARTERVRLATGEYSFTRAC